MYLTIKANEKSENILVGFPFKDGQFLDGEVLNDDGTVTLVVYLGDELDTNAAQEQHLNTNNDVISYKVAE